MALVKSRFDLGGEKITKKKTKNVGLFEHYHATFVGDLNTSIEAAKGRYGYGNEGDADYRAADPNSIPAPSQFWKVATTEVKEGKVTVTKPQMMEKTVKMSDGSKRTFQGEKVMVTLDVAKRAIEGVFDKRYRTVNGEQVEIKNSDRTAIIPHTMLIDLLEDIKSSAADAQRGDNGWGDAIHAIAKDVTDPGNRVKGEKEKEAARAAKPYCPIKDNWLPPEEHG